MASKLQDKLNKSSLATLLIALAAVLGFIFSTLNGAYTIYEIYSKSTLKTDLKVLSLNSDPSGFIPPNIAIVAKGGQNGFSYKSPQGDPKLKGKIAVTIRCFNPTDRSQSFINMDLSVRSAKDNQWYHLIDYTVADKSINPEDKANTPIRIQANTVEDVDVLFVMGGPQNIGSYGVTGYKVSWINDRGELGRSVPRIFDKSRVYDFNNSYKP